MQILILSKFMISPQNLKYLRSNITWNPPPKNGHNIRHQIHNDIY
jgi:hypothetical protein